MNNQSVMGYDLKYVREKLDGLPKKSSKEVCVEIVNGMVKMRHELKVSQQKLAEQSGVSQSVITRIENGETTPNMSTILKLLAVFGKTLYIGDLKNVELEDGAEPVAEATELTELPNDDLTTE